MGASGSRGRSLHWCMALLLIIGAVATAQPSPSAAQSDLRYFYETGHYLRGAFRQFWERSGGLGTFGYPITEEYVRSDGRIVQYFERARFELAPGNPPVVELGRLGVELTGDRIFPQVPPFQTNRDRRYFGETGHSLKGLFRRTWESRGDAQRIFGLPISEEINEQINGQWTLVQYFERARFELRLHPSRVEFGQLGRPLAPVQLLDPWPPEVAPPGPLNEDGTPRPPAGFRLGAPRATIRAIFDGHRDGDYRIEGEGFRPGERVRFLLEEPSGKVSSIDGQPLADVNGSISYAGVRFDADVGEGRWFVTAQGQTSGRTGIAVLQRGGAPAPGGDPGAGGVFVGTSPSFGTFGQAVLVQGSGFKPGEKVSMWLTAPDTTVRAIDAQPDADGSGSITSSQIRLTFDNTFRVGIWFITAQGRESGRQAIGQFRIDPGSCCPAAGGGQPAPAAPGPPGNPANLGQLIHDGLRPSGDGSIVPLAAPPEIPFTFYARGFAAGERVGVWLTLPEGSVSEIDPRTVRVDGGAVSVTFKVPKAQEGNWTVTAQGVSSGRAVTAPFRVTREFSAPPGTRRPANRAGAVSAAEGGQRTQFRISATGFRGGEQLEFWITSPDGLYYLAPSVTADSRGRIGYSPALVVQFSAQNPAGVYGYHYRGTRSGARADIYFTFTGAP